MEVDPVEPVEIENSFEIIRPIVEDLISTLTRPSQDEFFRLIVMDLIADCIAISQENNIATRRRGASTFLTEVPLDLMEIRRSSRGRGGRGGEYLRYFKDINSKRKKIEYSAN